MEFRKANIDELDSVMSILCEGRESIKQLGIDQWQLGYPQRGLVEEDIKLGQTYVMEDDAQSLIGTAAILFSGEPTYDTIYDGKWLTSSTSKNPAYCTIHRVAVARGDHRRGVGKGMILAIENLARSNGSKSVRVDTHPGNVPMRSLLGSLGYEECGIIYINHAGENTPERIAFEKIL